MSWINSNGYVRFQDGRKQPQEHRFVMEQSLGRKLTTQEDVHHINGDRADNRLENLMVMPHGEHIRQHLYKPESKELLVCPWCGVKFEVWACRNQECCSRTCHAYLMWARRRGLNVATT